MAKTSIFLHFTNKAEEAFNFYKSAFGSKFTTPMRRFGEIPSQEERHVSDDEKNLIMYVELPITGGHVLMGSDMPKSMGGKVTGGNNYSIALELDSKPEADRLFSALSSGGEVKMPLKDMFWGSYYGSFIDKYGVQWMISVPSKK